MVLKGNELFSDGTAVKIAFVQSRSSQPKEKGIFHHFCFSGVQLIFLMDNGYFTLTFMRHTEKITRNTTNITGKAVLEMTLRRLKCQASDNLLAEILALLARTPGLGFPPDSGSDRLPRELFTRPLLILTLIIQPVV